MRNTNAGYWLVLWLGATSALWSQGPGAPSAVAFGASMESSALRVSVRAADGAIRLLDKATGAVWAVNPPVVVLKNKVVIPARPAGKIVADGTSLHYAARLGIGHNPDFATPIEFTNLDGLDLGLEFQLRLRSGEPATVEYSFSMAAGTSVEEVHLLDQSLPLKESERNYYAVPFRMGLLVPVAGDRPYSRRLASSGSYSMAMLGAVKDGSAVLVTWDNPYTDIMYDYSTEPRRLTAGLALHHDARSLRLQTLGRGGYVEIAKAYRQVARERGLLKTLAEKLKDNPAVEKFFGAADFKPFALIRRAPNTRWNPTSRELVSVNFTFAELADFAAHLKIDLGIDRALLVLNGWINGGFDVRHPDILSAAPELGGNDALAECSRRVRSLGWLFGLHDNYQDIYRDAASYDERLVMRNQDGSLKEGGVWFGGTASLMCSRNSLKMAARPQNIPGVKKLFSPDVYFSDTIFASPLYECFSPEHPLTLADDLRNKQDLVRYIRKTVGLMGSEEGKEWGVPYADYFEGMMAHKTGFRVPESQRGDIVIPLFELVYADAIPIYSHQSGRPRPDYPSELLDHVLYAEMPVYYVGNHRYWLDPADDFQAGPDEDDRLVFARGGQFGLIDQYIKNTYEVLSPLNRLTALLPMTDHHFLTSDRHVESTRFGDDVHITVNYGDSGYRTERADLPQYGFLVESPTLVAFYAGRFGAVTYRDPPLFVIRSLDGTPLVSSRAVRIYHAFGDKRVEFRGKVLEIDKELVVTSDGR
jgi:Family of unknown function (DUF5696)